MHTPVRNAEDFTWLISRFADATSGVRQAIVVSSDGVLMASSDEVREHGEQLSAIVSGLQSLSVSTAQMFAKGEVEQLLLRMRQGHLVVMSVSGGSSLAVLTAPEADMKIIGHQMSLLIDSVAHALTPQLRTELLRNEEARC
ncbi:roadblock/LC7 domain-containing protein [Allosalinactinospora lopnorensis]|uniref:roadblock/LC7 domain-containing protein n=1 Tax=Allosalinactinospora lopnorensis TaxID=1352348 RepID=UPI000623C77A|nr:roadblock/LC7 domain-containing protein [Allosalinactinospora lopnorensis]